MRKRKVEGSFNQFRITKSLPPVQLRSVRIQASHDSDRSQLPLPRVQAITDARDGDAGCPMVPATVIRPSRVPIIELRETPASSGRHQIA